MKNGVGFTIGSFAIAMSRSRNGSEAASAGIFRRTFSESGKNLRAAKSAAEKKKAPEPAATIKNPRRSIPDGAVSIHKAAAKMVTIRAITTAGSERRAKATAIAMTSRTRTQIQTAADVSFFADAQADEHERQQRHITLPGRAL